MSTSFFLTPRVGLEPTTPRLTAVCSAIELSRNASTGCLPAPSKLHTEFHPSNTPRPQAFGQAFDRLVAVRCTRCRASTPALSTWCSPRGLIHFWGRPHLGAGFALRCLQRLSLPCLAPLPWAWQPNRCTSGPSGPVLSYWGRTPSCLLRPRRIGTELSHDVLNPARVPL